MSLFSRRTLQQLLLANRDILPASVCQRFAEQLNYNRIDSLSAQWELTTISALRTLATVTYEPYLGGSTRPDVLVTTSDLLPEFVADITAVSDEHMRELNPLDAFNNEFYRLLIKHRIPPKGFDIRMRSRLDERGKRREAVVDIPKPGNLHSFFAGDFEKFLRRISREPSRKRSWTPKDGAYSIEITYDPSIKNITGGYPGHDIDTDLTRNSLYRRFKKKYKQLRDSGYNGIRGIFVCDAGAPVFRQDRLHHSITVRHVVDEFLRTQPKIDFVVAVGAPPILYHPIGKTPRPSVSVFKNPQSTYPKLQDLVSHLQENLGSKYPKLLHDGRNARDFLTRYPGYQWHSLEGRNQYVSGETTMKVRMSARSLLHLFGGKTDFDMFMIRNGFVASEHNRSPMNPFAAACRRGDRLVDISLIPSDEDDDDYLEFVFEGLDAAVSAIVPDEPEE